MRNTSALWKEIISGEFKLEPYVSINGKKYTSITAPKIERSLIASAISVGNCISSSMTFSVYTKDEIPRQCRIVPYACVVSGNKKSEYLPFGTFYIAHRSVDRGLVTLQCYDAMQKTEQKYVDESLDDAHIGWPKSMQTCVNEIAQRIGVEVDSRTVIKTTEPYVVPYPQSMTMRQVLGHIGAANGGNWIITPDNKLRLVPLFPDINAKKARVDVVLGKITEGNSFYLSRITIARDSKLGYTRGNDLSFELRINSNPYACQAICDDLYESLGGKYYYPFSATKTCYDPALELGDEILIYGNEVDIWCPVFTETITLGLNFRSDISAPFKDEQEDEYPHLTEIERLKEADEALKNYMETSKDEIYSEIAQTYTNILLEVSGTYATQEWVSAGIDIVADAITSEVTRAQNAESSLSSKITQTASSIRSEVSSSISGVNGRIDETETSISYIEQTINSIDLAVENKVGYDDIINAIRISTEGVKIQASKLDLSIGGYNNDDGAMNVYDYYGDLIAKLDMDGLELYDIDGRVDFSAYNGNYGMYYWRQTASDSYNREAGYTFANTGTSLNLYTSTSNGDILIRSSKNSGNFGAYCVLSSTENDYPIAGLYASDGDGTIPFQGCGIQVNSRENAPFFHYREGGYSYYEEMFHSGNLLVQTGTVTIAPTSPAYSGGYKGSYYISDTKGFSNNAVMIVSAITSDPDVARATFKRASDGSGFNIYLWRVNQNSTGVAYMIIEPKFQTDVLPP